jgi:hypothetical protein
MHFISAISSFDGNNRLFLLCKPTHKTRNRQFGTIGSQDSGNRQFGTIDSQDSGNRQLVLWTCKTVGIASVVL